MLLIGDWSVEPERNRISRGNESRAIRPLPMDVLMHLVEREGDVVPVSELLDLFWRGRVGDDAVHRCISHLRKQLGDDPKTPVFIQTVYRRGYRLISPITRPTETGPTTGSYDQASEYAIDIGLPALDVRCDSLAPVAEVIWEDIVGLLSKIKIFRFNSSTPSLNNRVLRSKAVQTHDTIHLRLCIELGGQEVWSARFELNETDFSNAESEVVGTVADGFITGLFFVEDQRMRQLPEADLSSAELCLLAISKNADSTAIYENNRQLLDRALQLDPTIGLIYAAYSHLLAYSLHTARNIDRKKNRKDARRYAKKALSLEPADPLVAFYIAGAFWHLGDIERANAIIRSSYAESPLWIWSGKQKELLELDQFDKALRRQCIAARVNPSLDTNGRGPYTVYLLGGELEKARDIVLRETARKDSFIDWGLLANVLGQMGMKSDAADAWEKAKELYPGLSVERWRNRWSVIYANPAIVGAITDGLAMADLE